MRIAARQWGVITREQLIECGLSARTVTRWCSAGRLHCIHRGIYAMGHPSLSPEGFLVAALFHAGPGAALSHATATWWWGLIPHQPVQIEVSSLTRVRSFPNVRIHHPLELPQVRHRRLPVTTMPETLRDFASQAATQPLRNAIAEADYRRLLDVEAVNAACRQGKPGSTALRKALAEYEPQYAYTRSRVERAFLDLCRRHGIPLPDMNVRINGWLVDAVWPDARVVVELDGYLNHRSRAQLERDHQRDLALRAAGYTVVRYTETQVIEDATAVAQDVKSLLTLTDASVGSGSRSRRRAAAG